jgi:hypothetical protein
VRCASLQMKILRHAFVVDTRKRIAMNTYTPLIEEIEALEAETDTQRLRAENAALRMALSVARRERDEWRTIAEQCGPLGGEIDEYSSSSRSNEDCLCAR